MSLTNVMINYLLFRLRKMTVILHFHSRQKQTFFLSVLIGRRGLGAGTISPKSIKSVPKSGIGSSTTTSAWRRRWRASEKRWLT